MKMEQLAINFNIAPQSYYTEASLKMYTRARSQPYDLWSPKMDVDNKGYILETSRNLNFPGVPRDSVSSVLDCMHTELSKN